MCRKTYPDGLVEAIGCGTAEATWGFFVDSATWGKNDTVLVRVIGHPGDMDCEELQLLS